MRYASACLLLLLVACSDSRNGSSPSSAQPEPAVTLVANPSPSAALALFEKRILPIMQAPKPSSCAECHLSGVDLKDYIRPSQSETFTALVRADLIDVKAPANSKLLQFISRKPAKPNLLTDRVRQEEFEAFSAWINEAVKDPELLKAKASGKAIGPSVPDEVIRHAREDRVLASFLDTIWAEVGRCAACHSPDRNQKQVREHGEQVSWIKLRDPQATLDHIVEHELINVDEPEKSLLLTKPTMQVKHGGGQKMVIGDRGYQQFRRFIEDYAAVVRGKYTSANQLPKPDEEMSYSSDVWLKITDIPEKFDKVLLQVDLYRQEGNGWSADRWASSDRLIFGKGRLWQHSLSLTAPRGSRRAESIRDSRSLPPGRYLAKIYLDREGKLQKDPTSRLGDAEFVGQVEIDSRWPAGYGQMTTARFVQLN